MPSTSPTALVTGASEGIGRAFARQLAAAGYSVTAVARGEERLRTLMDELGPGHTYLAVDLSTEEGRQRVVHQLALNPVGLLVNNAGVAIAGQFATAPLDDALATMHLNCDALVTLAHAFLAQARPGDALLNVSSTLAFTALPSLSVYSATKAFVTSFSESLWYEQRTRGVYVMGLCPGMTATNSQAHTTDQAIPAGMVQTPEEVVATALAALKRRKRPTIVSGRLNSLLATVTRLLPRKSVVAMVSAGSADTDPYRGQRCA